MKKGTYAQIKTYKKYKNSTLKSHVDKYHFNNKTFDNAQQSRQIQSFAFLNRRKRHFHISEDIIK